MGGEPCRTTSRRPGARAGVEECSLAQGSGPSSGSARYEEGAGRVLCLQRRRGTEEPEGTRQCGLRTNLVRDLRDWGTNQGLAICQGAPTQMLQVGAPSRSPNQQQGSSHGEI